MPVMAGTYGEVTIQNSCVLKHLPSRLTTQTLITLAAGNKHSKPETRCLQNRGHVIARGGA